MNVPPIVVATSINPFGRVAEQLRVFRQWRRLGVEILTFNVEAEAKRLIDAGVPESCIEVIDVKDTAQEQSGKPIPRIAPILTWLQREKPGRNSILVNSDIYPAVRSADFVGSWLEIAPALALTREETPIVEDYDIDSLAPYRGGLDAFVFSAEGLKQVNQSLSELEPTDAMCFGVPGWDYLLGAVIEHEDVGGVVMDSGLLLHQSHETTYVDIQEFEQFRPSIVELAGLMDGGFAQVAEGYATHIETSCRSRSRETEAIRSMYFQPAAAEAEPSEQARRIAWALRVGLPSIAWRYRQNALVALIDGQIAEKRPSFFALCTFFLRSQSNERAFLECLLAILCGLRCTDADADGQPLPDGFDRENALASIHRAAMTDPMQKRLEIAHLFGASLISHGSFDSDLFNEIALRCENDDERAVARLIGAQLDEASHAI